MSVRGDGEDTTSEEDEDEETPRKVISVRSETPRLPVRYQYKNIGNNPLTTEVFGIQILTPREQKPVKASPPRKVQIRTMKINPLEF